MMLFLETETAKQNQKFPFHFFFRFAAEGWGEEAREKCKEIFWFLHTLSLERVRGALVRITTQSERTRQFQVTTRSARAKWVRAKVNTSPPIYDFRVLGGCCLGALRLGRRASRAKVPFCEDLPRSAWRKGNGLVLDLEVRTNLF